jgi:hypothetical protein
LHHGTWIASGTIAVGLTLARGSRFAPNPRRAAHAAPSGMSIVTAGIALFILLPIMRLILILGVCLHQRDYRFSAIAALLPAIVAAGLRVGAA